MLPVRDVLTQSPTTINSWRQAQGKLTFSALSCLTAVVHAQRSVKLVQAIHRARKTLRHRLKTQTFVQCVPLWFRCRLCPRV